MSGATPARRAAFSVLRRVFEDDSYADRALAAVAEGLEPRERAFAQQLAYGAVQRVRTLDHAIDALGRRPMRKLDPPVRAALRLGAYQVIYLDAVPARAAANESVELVRSAGLERATAFTNAVMRRLAEGGRQLAAALPDDTPQAAALRYSYPDWVAETFWRDFGADDARALMAAQNEAPETVVRLNRRRNVAVVTGAPDPLFPDALRVDRIESSWLERGLVWPQSRGSQLAGLAVGAGEGERTLDLCAAPGGKATMLAGEVVAVDKHEGRARELQANCELLGAANVTVVHADALELPPELTGFDHALVDAPCSGLGVLARRPDLRWRAKPPPELQLALVRAAAERVRPGGTLTYSVCTLNADENEAIVEASGLEPDPALGDEWPDFRHPSRPEFLLTLPHVHRTSGFFIARLRVPTPRIQAVRWSDVREVEVEPSLYAADFANLGRDVELCLDAGVQVFHFDVGDGHFVEPVTIGPIVLQAIAPLVHERGGLLDCHLMVDNPERHIPQIAKAGGDSVTVHVEVGGTAELIALAREHGLGAGVAFNPGTAVADAARAAEGADIVLCMSIWPGYSGQAFMPEALDRARELRGLLPADVRIQVDGGVGRENAGDLREAGVTLLVAGTSVFGADDPGAAYRELAALAA